jgi:hypothetical protein
MFLRNVGWRSPGYTELSKYNINSADSRNRRGYRTGEVPTPEESSSFIYPAEGCNMFFRNIGTQKYLANYTASRPTEHVTFSNRNAIQLDVNAPLMGGGGHGFWCSFVNFMPLRWNGSGHISRPAKRVLLVQWSHWGQFGPETVCFRSSPPFSKHTGSRFTHYWFINSMVDWLISLSTYIFWRHMRFDFCSAVTEFRQRGWSERPASISTFPEFLCPLEQWFSTGAISPPPQAAMPYFWGATGKSRKIGGHGNC